MWLTRGRAGLCPIFRSENFRCKWCFDLCVHMILLFEMQLWRISKISKNSNQSFTCTSSHTTCVPSCFPKNRLVLWYLCKKDKNRCQNKTFQETFVCLFYTDYKKDMGFFVKFCKRTYIVVMYMKKLSNFFDNWICAFCVVVTRKPNWIFR
jgi:hypothetical protein